MIKRGKMMAGILVVSAVASFLTFGAHAQDAGGALAGLGNSKDPVQIDSAQLEVIDKEQKAIYSGDVVVRQGPTMLRCSRLVVFYDRQNANSGQNAAAGQGNIRKLECEGPLSAVSGNSTVTGDRGTYDGKSQVINVIGNVILTDCNNVQRGDKMTYNIQTGVATVSGGRISGVFGQGGSSNANGCQ
jgi:lipopolysaccharide export system protein LptA